MAKRRRCADGYRSRLAAGLGLALAVTACRPTPTTTATPSESAATADSKVGSSHTTPEPTTTSCGTPGLTIEEHGWVLHRAPAVVSVDLTAPELDEALRQLGEFSRQPGHGLPIPLAFSLGQWSWQIPALRATLQRAGFDPASLVFVAGERSAHAWVWRSDCDLDEAIERIEAAWDVTARRTVDAVVATPNAPTESEPEPEKVTFPYDVLLLPADRIALVPAGMADSIRRSWSEAPRADAPGAAPKIGDRLDTVAPAAIRLVVSNEGLLDPTVQTGDHPQLAWRATAQGVTAAEPAADEANK